MPNCDDADARPEDSMHAYHSVWMSHWMQTSCQSTSGVHNHFSFDDEKKKDGHDSKQASVPVQADEPRKDSRLDVGNASPSILHIDSNSPHSAKVGAVTETEGVKIRNEALSMKSLNPSNVRKWQSFPLSNFVERKKSILTSKKDLSFNGRHLPISQIHDRSDFGTTIVHENGGHFSSKVLSLAPTGVKCSSRAHHHAEGVSQRSGDLVKPNKSPENKSFLVSRTFQDKHTASSSNFLLCEFETQGLPLQSSKGRNREDHPLMSNECITKSKFAIKERKNCNYHGYSTFLVHDEKMDDPRLTARYSGSPPQEPNGESQQLYDPSTSDMRFPTSIGEQGRRCNFPGSRFFPSNNCPPVFTKSEELNYGCHSLHRMPKCSFHDSETLRICTTGDSVEVLPGSPPKISQTTHHFLMTKKTDVDLSEGCKMLRESTVSTKLKGNAFNEFPTLLPDIGHNANLGAKLQIQRKVGAAEVTGDGWNPKPGSEGSKNELSAETDAMDIDALQERNLLPDVASYLSNKDVCQKPAKPQATMASLRKRVESGKAKSDLPVDINQGPLASAEGDGAGDRELSSSRTESLEVEHLFSLAEQTGNSTISPHQDSNQCLEPDSRWVKRLKLSASDSLPHVTKHSKMGDSSTSEKVNKKFGKIMNHSSSSSQDMVGKYSGKRQMDSKTEVLLSNGESSSFDSEKESSDLTFSWVHRWCHDKAAALLAKPRVNLVCEPQSSKAALYEFEKKQFPSIAAMALMGKAMNGFRPCEFRRKGSFVVWNTEGF